MIQTGKTPVTLMTLLAILSISLVVNLPGLAVTPMLGSLSKVFPDTSQLEKQLLTILPNLLIIPFVLLSGKLSLTRHKTAIVVTGLVIFTACAIGYLMASGMVTLIVLSCLLGCGAGLVVPLSSGLIADTFCGTYRMKEMGVKSGISNSSLVVATFAVGWLSHGDWHWPFLVYLVVLIPLVLSFWLRGIPRDPDGCTSPAASSAGAHTAAADASSSSSPKVNDPDEGTGQDNRVVKGFYVGRLWTLICVYAFITFAVMAITYYCPFLIEKKDWSSSLTGTVTAIFFLGVLIPGFSLEIFVKVLKRYSFVATGVMMTAGLALFSFTERPWAMCIGAALAGLGYGICQPLIYDKASRAVTSENMATLALAIVLAANYIAIVLTPFIIDGLRSLLHASHVACFAFLVCFVTLAAYTVVAFIARRRFVFNVRKEYYQK